MAGRKVYLKWCTNRPKSPKKIIEPRVLEKKVCLFTDTSAIATANKQLLSSSDVE